VGLAAKEGNLIKEQKQTAVDLFLFFLFLDCSTLDTQHSSPLSCFLARALLILSPTLRMPSSRAAELERALADFDPRDFACTAFASLLSIPLSKASFVPPRHRYLPLLVLGAVGGLTDFYLTEQRLQPLRAELAALKASEAPPPPTTTQPSTSPSPSAPPLPK
jgi:hypothetical protein